MCGAQALGTRVTAHRLSCLAASGILPDQGSAPCTDRRIPSHCTTREVPGVVLNEVPAFLLQEESARAGSASLVWLPPQNPQWPHCPSPGQPSLACPTQELVVPPFHPQVQEERLVLGLRNGAATRPVSSVPPSHTHQPGPNCSFSQKSRTDNASFLFLFFKIFIPLFGCAGS